MMHREKGVKGMDVSRWQGDIDWEQTAASGIGFAMIRAAYGCSEDIRFRQNMEGARKAGLPTGVYLYSLAASEEEALEEARFLKELLTPYRLSYPAAYDVEDRRQQELPRKALTDMVLAFCGSMEQGGYLPALYGSVDWLENRYDSRIDMLDLWVAQWGSSLTFRGTAGLWQYSGSGRVPGVPVRADLNLSFRSYPSLVRAVGGRWQRDDRGWQYRFADGSMPRKEWIRLEGRWYWFDEEGYAVTGLRIIDGKPYYFAEGSAEQDGFSLKECQCLITSGSGALR